jgi:hypothetical protein
MQASRVAVLLVATLAVASAFQPALRAGVQPKVILLGKYLEDIAALLTFILINCRSIDAWHAQLR